MKEDGSFRLDQRYFDYSTGLRMTNDSFAALFGVPARKPEDPLEPVHMDLAASIQYVTEEINVAPHPLSRRRDGRSQPLSGGWRRAQLRRQRQSAARWPLRRALGAACRR